MFTRFKSHDHPSRSIHQTPSHVQVLRQHDLKYNKQRECSVLDRHAFISWSITFNQSMHP